MPNTEGKNDNNENNKKSFNSFNKKSPNNKNNEGSSSKNALIWLFVILGITTIFLIVSENKNYDSRVVPYTTYKSLLDGNHIKEAIVYKSQLNDYEIHAELYKKVTVEINGRSVELDKFNCKLGVLDSDVEALWAEKGVKWSYESGDNNFLGFLYTVGPLILLVVLFIFIMRKMQGGSGGGQRGLFSFGKARVKLLNEAEIKVTFKDVAGADEAKYELQEVIEFLKIPDKFKKLGAKIPQGVLLLGPPGTGKTLMARAVAGEADVPFFTMSGADFVEMFVGVGASRVRDLFEQAKKNSPCICFIDEIDAVGRQRGAGLGGGHDEREQTLNQLLVEMDGFEKNSGVIIIAATNRPDVLDPALLRPGRFDRQVVVDRPDVRGREGIFKVHVRDIPLGADIDLKVLAQGTPGLSGADIANIVNEAALLAARRDSSKVTMYDFENAKDKILMGIERKSMIVSDKEKEMTAYHEMGHALVGKLLAHPDPVHKVTIIPRGRALGITSYLPNEEFHSKSRDYLETNLAVMMGGRAAESLIFDVLSTGASNDIQHATKIARKMVCEWGMSNVLGPVNFATSHDDVFLGREMGHGKDHSEKTSEIIDKEIRLILDSAYDKAKNILNENLEILHKTSKLLLDRETIDGSELSALLKGEELPPISKMRMEAIKSLNIKREEEAGDKIINPEDDTK